MVAAATLSGRDTDGLASDGGRGRSVWCQPARSRAERYRCACWLAGRGDGCQCGLDWGLSNHR